MRSNAVKSPSRPKQPFVVKLARGTYFWCACGRTKRPPYCDGSHRGTLCSPLRIDQGETAEVKLCGCQGSPVKPFCDCLDPKR